MIARAVERKDYPLILKLDRRAYPADSPVTSKILDKWYAKNPEFGLVYEKDKAICGICIAVPLNRFGWDKLINGRIRRSIYWKKMKKGLFLRLIQKKSCLIKKL